MGLLRSRLRGVVAEIDLAPRVLLDPASQRVLQRAVEDRGVDINYVERGIESTTFGRRSPNSRESLSVAAHPGRLSIDASFCPGLDLIIMEMDEIVKAARDTLQPRFLAGVRVSVVKQTRTPEGDARVYLGDQVLQLSPERRASLGRPIHRVGIGFFMPPYTLTEGESAGAQETDGVEVRIESLDEDVSDLYLHCSRYFPEPIDPATFESLRPFIERTNNFLDRQVAQFLQLSGPDEGASDG